VPKPLHFGSIARDGVRIADSWRIVGSNARSSRGREPSEIAESILRALSRGWGVAGLRRQERDERVPYARARGVRPRGGGL
jgi:hypothetical protein